MQIKTITNGTASLRKVTLGHAVRILVTEVLQSEGHLDSVWSGENVFESFYDCDFANVMPDRYCFVTEDTSHDFSGNAQEMIRFYNIADLAIKAGRTRAEKFDAYSQKLWMLSVLHRHESPFLTPDPKSSLYELADTIDVGRAEAALSRAEAQLATDPDDPEAGAALRRAQVRLSVAAA